MSKLKMEIYNAASGAQLTIRWRDEREYSLGKAFLKDMGCGSTDQKYLAPGQPEFFYLESDQQLDALYAFRQELRKSR